jgi:peptidyl-prolyl cis-trans isomerase SurA
VVSPVRIEQYYKENKDQFYQEDAVHVRMIQFSRHEGDTDDSLMSKGRLVLARLRDGERFEDIAREVSEDLHHSRGSDWSWMTRTNMNATFTDQVFALKKGEVTEPIITPDGCFIFYAEDRRYAGIQPLDQVRDQIEHLLVTQMSNDARERWLERLRRDGYVKRF